MKPSSRAWLIAASLLAPAAALAQLRLAVEEPRAFGHFVGDVVTRRITLMAPAPLALDETSLPQIGRRGTPLELRAVAARRDGERTELRLDYQVFAAPTEVRVFELPPLVLRFAGGVRPEEVRVDAWPIAVAPLGPAEASPREGLSELRPDRPPPPIDTRGPRLRLAAYALAAVGLLGYLAWVYLALPWWVGRHRPFGDAWREVRGLPPGAGVEPLRAATRRVHEAFNRSAGQALFEQGVDGFVAARPRFAPLRDEMIAFFRRSRETFFAQGAEPGDAAWLVDFCRRCRDAERGAA